MKKNNNWMTDDNLYPMIKLYIWIFVCILLLLCAQLFLAWIKEWLIFRDIRKNNDFTIFLFEAPNVAAKTKAVLAQVWFQRHSLDIRTKNLGLCSRLTLFWLCKWAGKHPLSCDKHVCLIFKLKLISTKM